MAATYAVSVQQPPTIGQPRTRPGWQYVKAANAVQAAALVQAQGYRLGPPHHTGRRVLRCSFSL